MDPICEAEFSYKRSDLLDRFAESCEPGDEQGIPFLDKPNLRRSFRERRNRNYRSYRNETLPLDVDSGIKGVEKTWFGFEACYAGVPCKAEHFQLKHCVQASPTNSLYFTGPNEGQLSIFDPLTRESRLLLFLTEKDRMAITSFSVRNSLIALGGLHGELYIDTLDGEAKSRHNLSPRDLGNITNSVNFVDFHGSLELMVGSNNQTVWFFDIDAIPTPKREYRAEYNVNCVALNASGGLIGLVGDSVECHVLSSDTMKPAFTLHGHKDHNFSVAWHPNKDYLLATGGQDRSVRVWDVRAVGEARCTPLATMFGELAGVLNVQFTGDGELLAWSETVDYLHLTDSLLFSSSQCISFFGEISGFAFSRESPSPASLYIGICDSSYPAIYEVRRLTESVGEI